MDIILASSALLILSPILLLIGIAIRMTSGNPVIFRQWRSGRYGRQFQLLKFRTMHAGNPEAPRVTRSGDSRVTPIGKCLRKSKLDELPQLFNVLRGEMTLVGPRPDLDEFWEQTSPSVRQALALCPGLTGSASLVFRNEEVLLAQLAPEQLSSFYIDKVLPAKAELDLEYAAQATFLTDCTILLRTVAAAAGIRATDAPAQHLLHEQLSRQ
jgi:lipopolysaccharide/colanic/teichoic acid biosynthesis glycosyltransferase